MTIGEKIRAARTELGWSQETLAKTAGVPQSQVSELETGKRKTTRFLPELATALKKRIADFDERFEPEGVYKPPPQFMDAVNTMPVYASAEGGQGTIIVSTDEIDRYPRPHTLSNIVDAYAILITGDSMSPAYKPGDHAWVNPRLPPQRDTECVLYEVNEETGDARATIKNLVSYTDKEWRLEQYNPAKKFSLRRDRWSKCHRVVGNFRRR